MSQPVQQATPSGPLSGIEASFNNHKGAWTIGLAIFGILVTLYLFSRSASSGSSTGSLSSSTDTGTPATNSNASGSTASSDYTSILTALEGLTSSDAQSATATSGILTQLQTTIASLQTTISGLPTQITTAVKAGVPAPVQVASPSAPDTGTSAAAQSFLHYTVKPGDSLYSIANQFGESVSAIKLTPGNWTAANNGLQGNDNMNGYYWPVHSGEVLNIYPGRQ